MCSAKDSDDMGERNEGRDVQTEQVLYRAESG